MRRVFRVLMMLSLLISGCADQGETKSEYSKTIKREKGDDEQMDQTKTGMRDDDNRICINQRSNSIRLFAG